MNLEHYKTLIDSAIDSDTLHGSDKLTSVQAIIDTDPTLTNEQREELYQYEGLSLIRKIKLLMGRANAEELRMYEQMIDDILRSDLTHKQFNPLLN